MRGVSTVGDDDAPDDSFVQCRHNEDVGTIPGFPAFVRSIREYGTLLVGRWLRVEP